MTIFNHYGYNLESCNWITPFQISLNPLTPKSD